MATVTGPASSTDNAIARWDGTSGDKIQNSGLIVTDSGNLQSTGGNARGTNATDLQVSRTSANQVASGLDSVISGGANNLAAGSGSTIGGGVQNSVSGEFATVGGGGGNSVTGGNSFLGGGESNALDAEWGVIGGGDQNQIGTGSDYSTIAGGRLNVIAEGTNRDFIGGGESNQVSGDYAAITGGRENEGIGNYSSVGGGYKAKADKYGQTSHASGSFSNSGDAQASEYVLRISTNNTTQTTLCLDGVGTTFKFTIASGSSWVFRGLVVGRDSGGNSACWEIKGGIKNISGTSSLIGTPTVTLLGADSAAVSAGWGVTGAVAVSADNTNDALKIAVTGAASTNIRWVATVSTGEVSY